MKVNDVFLFGGLGIALYSIFSKNNAGIPSKYPPTTQPKPQQPPGGITGGSGSGSGGAGSGSGSGSGSGIRPPGNGNPQPGDANFVGPVYRPPQPGDPNFVGPVDDPNGYNYDSGDPCDQNSYAYDPSQCGSDPAQTGIDVNPDWYTYDSGDPCDSNSSAYDPQSCMSQYGYPASGNYDASEMYGVPYDDPSAYYDANYGDNYEYFSA